MSCKPESRGVRTASAFRGPFRLKVAGIGLAAFMVAAGATGAEAGASSALRVDACGSAPSAPSAPVAACRASSFDPRTRVQGPSGLAAATGVRLVLTASRGAAPILLGAEPEATPGNPFSLVGNRTGLETSSRTEIRNGEVWLVSAPAEPSAVGLAAFQGGGSSVASE